MQDTESGLDTDPGSATRRLCVTLGKSFSLSGPIFSSVK